jgi:hypothetical protein
MKTAFKSLALGLLVSSSCGFAAQSFGEDLQKSLTLPNVAAIILVGAAYDKLQEYVLAPYLKQTPVVGGALEFVRNLLDTKSNRNAGK